jgi:hypothetical protein
MMRMAWVILLMAVLAAGVVQLRVRQNAARAETYRLEAERVNVRRRLWDQQIQLSVRSIPRPAEGGERAWALELVGPGESTTAGHVARRD